MDSVEKKYYLFDVKDRVLGRSAVQIAKVLSGRGKVDYTPHIDGGDYVVVINSDKVRVTGSKNKQKMYHHYSGYPGGVKSFSFEKKIEINSCSVIEEAVYGMLPKNKLRSLMMKRLLIFKDEKHPHKIDINL